MSLADWRRVIDVNLTAPFMLTQKILPLMKKDSQFVFINSVGGRQTFPEWSAYCSYKFGLKAFADTLRQEVAKRGIKVTTLFSASVDTVMHSELPYNWDRSKMLKPKDVANALVYLLNQSPEVVIKEMDIENIAGTF
jgi:NADP-dependent 3-hydroxy acid dehydrogenase YdfG